MSVKNPLCQTCRLEAGYKKVPTANGKSFRWKCQSCLKWQTVSFMSIKDRRIFK